MGRSLAEVADAFFRLGAGTYTEPIDAVDAVDAAPPPAPAPPARAPPTILVFDTETDGGKGGQLAVQIAWCVYDAAGYEQSTRCEFMTLPPGRTINGLSLIHI